MTTAHFLTFVTPLIIDLVFFPLKYDVSPTSRQILDVLIYEIVFGFEYGVWRSVSVSNTAFEINILYQEYTQSICFVRIVWGVSLVEFHLSDSFKSIAFQNFPPRPLSFWYGV